jgi:hypothetical protein
MSFLSSLLPAVVGAGLAYTTGGSSLLIGGAIAAEEAIRQKSLQKGLMAGLGAYGGAEALGALSATGTQIAAQDNAINAMDIHPPSPAVGGVAGGVQNLTTSAGRDAFIKNLGANTIGGAGVVGAAAAAPTVAESMKPQQIPQQAADSDPGQQYIYNPGYASPTPAPDVPSYSDMLNKPSNFGRQMNYQPGESFVPVTQQQRKQYYGYASGGISAAKNPIEEMSNKNAIGANTGFPQAYLHNNAYATPYQTPVSQNVLTGPGDVGLDPYTGEQKMASGGISDTYYNLGSYSDGGRLLRGPGDGVSDSIPATIGHKQPARLADGEFVVPARIVSELGNGSTEAGARKLYAMMDRIQSARKQTVGKGKAAHNSRADKYLPA